jgi:hypothetical protein
MQYEEVVFQGNRSDIDELLIALQSVEEVTDIEVQSVTSSVASIMGRDPLYQNELVDIAIGIAVNLASSAIYDRIRHEIDENARRKGFSRKSATPTNSNKR